jgi:glyoxylase-like metal-dependent hydrolase (beta-lactamase superfamily II)
MTSGVRLLPWVTAATLAGVLVADDVAVLGQAPAELESWHVRGGIHFLAGPGGNTTVQIGKDGVLVVDTQTASAGGPLLAAIRRLSEAPIRFIVNTSADADHVGGNAVLKKTGQILAGGNTRAATVYGGGGAPIFSHENALSRLAAGGTAPEALPTDTYFVKQKDMFVNGEPVQLFHQRAAHTDGDTLVMFRRSDVIAAGDVFTPDRYPLIDLAKGGSVNGILASINFILELAVPEFNEEGGTLIVPGHGRLCDESDVSDYRDMVTIVRDRVLDMVKKKMTLDQVRAAKPSRDYDGVYGRPDHTGDMFVEAVYRSLMRTQK